MRYAVTITLAGAALYLAWTFNARQTGLYDSRRRTGAEGAVRILQFYVTPAVLIEEQQALPCCGVANAVSMRMEPPVEKIEPSPNRCVEVRLDPAEVELGAAVRGCFWVAPRQTTRCRLTAVGTLGRQAERELTVAVP